MKKKLGTDLEIFRSISPASKCRPKAKDTMRQKTNERELGRRRTREGEVSWEGGKEKDEDDVSWWDGEEEGKDEVGEEDKDEVGNWGQGDKQASRATYCYRQSGSCSDACCFRYTNYYCYCYYYCYYYYYCYCYCYCCNCYYYCYYYCYCYCCRCYRFERA